MIKNEKIDVIIPIFNSSKYIIACLDSVVKQTILPTKIIIADDGSTDNSVEIVKNFLNQSTCIPFEIYSQINKGIGGARNLALKHSTSEYIAFLDSDDLWYSAKLETQLEVFKSSSMKELGVVYCAYENIDAAGVAIDAPVVKPSLRGNVEKALLFGNYISGSGSAVIMKRSCFEKVGFFSENRQPTEDWDYWIRIANYFEYDFSDKILVKIRRHTLNSTNPLSELNYLESKVIFQKKYFNKLNENFLPNEEVFNTLFRSKFNLKSFIKIYFSFYDYNVLNVLNFHVFIFHVFIFKIFWKLYRFSVLSERKLKDLESYLIGKWTEKANNISARHK